MDGEIDHDDAPTTTKEYLPITPGGGKQKGLTPLLPNDICKAFRAQRHETTDPQLEVIRQLKNYEESHTWVGLPVHPPISSLRQTNVRFVDASGTELGRSTVRALCDAATWERRGEDITAGAVNFALVQDKAADLLCAGPRDIYLMHMSEKISSALELEACLNDFQKGIRETGQVELVVHRHEDKRGRPGKLQSHRTLVRIPC
jgi:hypothetical protein